MTRIDPSYAAHITSITARPAAQPASHPAGEAAPAPARRPDAVNFSDGLGRLRQAHAAAAEAPDVRAERVAAIKAQVQAGTYQVDTDALADKLLSHL